MHCARCTTSCTRTSFLHLRNASRGHWDDRRWGRDDLLLANSVLDVDRLTAVATAAESAGVIARVAVDSVETIEAAHLAGIRDVIIDVDVGMPRCGARPTRLANSLTSHGNADFRCRA